MGKHTPGPWRTRKEKRSTLVCDEYGNQIALIRPVKKYGIEGDTEANARLIAEAPMMYEALKDLYVWHTGGCKINESCQCGQCLTCRVRALLARIEGGE